MKPPFLQSLLSLVALPVSLVFFSILLSSHSNLHAETVLKFDFGGSAPAGDMSFDGTDFGTIDDGDVATTGEQTSSVTSNGFLDSVFADIPSDASLTISGITMAGSAIEAGVSIFQQTTGGSFDIFDDMNMLLLSGNLGNGVIAGGVGSSSASFFTTTPTIFTGGTLLPLVLPSSGVVSLTLNDVSTGGSTGLSVSAGNLNNFTADVTGQIEAVAVPEPSLGLASTLIFGYLIRRRRNTHTNSK